MPVVKLGSGKAWQQPSQSARIDRIYKALDNAGCEQGSGEDWQCPAHEDNKASLGVARGTEGRILLNCQKGCAVGAILKALGLPKSVIAPDSVPVDEYVYTDEEGSPLYRVVRYRVGDGGKSFVQEKWNGREYRSGKDIMAGVRTVLYELPRVRAAAEAGEVIWFFEGEKDVNKFRARTRDKYAATSAPRGAKNWQDGYADAFVGARKVNICADRDADGYRHALAVAESCSGRGIAYGLYLPAPEEPKADYSDHANAGYKLSDLVKVSRAELQSLLEQARLASPADAGDVPSTDADAARVLYARYGTGSRWVDTGGQRGYWLVWSDDKLLWVKDLSGICVRRIHDLSEEYMGRALKDYQQAQALQSGVAIAGDTLRMVKNMKNTARIKTILESFRTIEPGMTISEEQLDSDRELLGVANGAVYLGPYPELVGAERARSAYLTRTTGVAARLNADGRVDRSSLTPEGSAIWQAYLDQFLPDPELQEFLGRVVGYSLLGGNPAGLLFCLIGPPHTGKTTFSNAVTWALGDYASVLNFSAFHGDMSNKPREDIADIVSARVAMAPELNTAWELHSDQIKRLTGSDRISYNRKYEKQVRRYPDFTAFLASNGNPRIRGADQALKDRICCIPFRHPAPDGKDDTAEKLKRMDAREAVLAWILEGFERYRGTGLRPEKWPEIVLKFTRSVVSRLDDVDNFLRDECKIDIGNDAWRIPTKDVYPRYRAWCEETNTRPTTSQQFGQELTGKGIPSLGKWYDGGMVKCRIGLQWRR